MNEFSQILLERNFFTFQFKKCGEINSRRTFGITIATNTIKIYVSFISLNSCIFFQSGWHKYAYITQVCLPSCIATRFTCNCPYYLGDIYYYYPKLLQFIPTTVVSDINHEKNMLKVYQLKFCMLIIISFFGTNEVLSTFSCLRSLYLDAINTKYLDIFMERRIETTSSTLAQI